MQSYVYIHATMCVIYGESMHTAVYVIYSDTCSYVCDLLVFIKLCM